MARISITEPEPIVFRDDEERDVWTNATVSFASAALSNGGPPRRVVAADLADSLIRERRSREQAITRTKADTIRRAAGLIRDDRGEFQITLELDAIADEMEAARRPA